MGWTFGLIGLCISRYRHVPSYAYHGRNALPRTCHRFFATYANKYIGPWAGYLTTWCYWFMWITVGMSEITAIGIYLNFWFPDLPSWIPALIGVAIVSGANLVSVKYYGEFEFWFALIKVVTIAAMLVIGFGLIFFGLGNNGIAIGLSNLTFETVFLSLEAGAVLLIHYRIHCAFNCRHWRSPRSSRTLCKKLPKTLFGAS